MPTKQDRPRAQQINFTVTPGFHTLFRSLAQLSGKAGIDLFREFARCCAHEYGIAAMERGVISKEEYMSIYQRLAKRLRGWEGADTALAEVLELVFSRHPGMAAEMRAERRIAAGIDPRGGAPSEVLQAARQN